MRAADKQAVLRHAGLRVTRPRLAVLEAISESGHHDVETVVAKVTTLTGHVSVQAVYDNLRALEQAGLTRRIQPAGGAARYEVRTGDNHHHVVCRGCGATADVDCAIGKAPCLEPHTDHGFVIDEAEVTYWGMCPDCQTTKSHTRGVHP